MSTASAKYTYSYSPAGHATWATLVARQKKHVKNVASKEFFKGFKNLALDPKHLPNLKEVSKRLKKQSGWTLSNARSKNLSMREWFPLLLKRSFPVTDYIRTPENIDYAPQPDLFHEYFGHLSFFTDQAFADIAHKFGVVAKKANNRQLVEISRIWWYTAEFGFVKENGKLKMFGAGLLSSPGENTHAQGLVRKGKIKPFNIDEVIRTPGSTHEYHKKYFYLNNISETLDYLKTYAERESLQF